MWPSSAVSVLVSPNRCWGHGMWKERKHLTSTSEPSDWSPDRSALEGGIRLAIFRHQFRADEVTGGALTAPKPSKEAQLVKPKSP